MTSLNHFPDNSLIFNYPSQVFKILAKGFVVNCDFDY